MPTFIAKSTFTVGGVSFPKNDNIDCNMSEVIEHPAKVAAAKAGTLTTRTDNDTGVVTLSAGHGVTTGMRVDLYWEVGGVKGRRYGMAATVSGNAVTVDAGGGDNLPIATSVIQLAVALEMPALFIGDDLQGIGYYSQARGQFIFTDDADAMILAVNFADVNEGDGWFTGNGVTNPFAGDTVAKVYMSHNDTTAVKTMRVGLGVN